MKMNKKFLALMLAITIFCTFGFPAVSHAEYLTAASQAEYDITTGGEQHFTLINENGETVNVTIVEEPQTTRLENRTYSVSYESALSWKAGYKVDIKNNLISSVHSPYHQAYVGIITYSKLVKDSSKQATYRMNHKVAAISTVVGVRTVISGTTLKVYAI